MQTTTILDDLRLMSSGDAFLWAINEAHDSALFQVTAAADPHVIDSACARIERGGPSLFLWWDGSALATMADAEEAAFVAQDRIAELRQVVKFQEIQQVASVDSAYLANLA